MSNAGRTSTLSTLSENWWTLALRGVVAVLFGILALFLPAITLVTLVFVLGAYALVGGILALVAGIRGSGRRWLLLAEGLLGIFAGILALALPVVTIEVLIYVIAAWAVLVGLLELLAALLLGREGERVALVVGGVLFVIAGVGLAFLPRVIVLSLVIVVGIYAIIFGAVLIALAFRVRGRGASSRVT